MAKRPPPSEEQWLQHKDFIQYQFLVRNQKLKDLVITLSERGFVVTNSQLEAKLKKWAFSKNLSESTWQYIDRKITKRTAEFKATDVIHSGKRLKQEAVIKSTNRHRETKLWKQIEQSRSPPLSPTNPYLTVCTPPSLWMEFDEWPVRLPWLRFENTFKVLAGNFRKPTHFSVNLDSLSPIMQSFFQVPTSRRIITQTSGNFASMNVSRMAAYIGMIMPEWYEGEHVQTTQMLLQHPEKDAVKHYFKFMIYLISNGFQGNSLWYNDWAKVQDLLLRLGITDLQIDLRVLSEDEITIKALLERLFELAIGWATHPSDEKQTFGLIKWLLKSGQDPNQPLCMMRCPEVITDRITAPVEVAILQGCPELLELLLKSGAILSHEGVLKKTAFQLIMMSYQPGTIKIRIIELLIRYNPSLTQEEILNAAIKSHDLNFIDVVLAPGDADLTKGVTVDHEFTPMYEETALSAAIAVGSDVATLILNHIAFLDPSKLAAPFITTGASCRVSWVLNDMSATFTPSQWLFPCSPLSCPLVRARRYFAVPLE
ncbi:hypothetical protein IL306_013656 [Fusarium sp. DS 682]|nr:hypothetical protein IL306_013656 [Fusarium sp. DS 682]